MRACRIARRVASAVWLCNSFAYAVSARTLATKVSHYSCQSFSCAGGGRPTSGRAVRWAATGVRLALGSGGGCRIEWGEPLALTPFGWVVLVTKELHGGKA